MKHTCKLSLLFATGLAVILNSIFTAAAQPALTTLAASGITGTNAMLNGTVNPNGAASTAYFQYGVTTGYGSFSTTNSLMAGNTTLSVSNLISSLVPNTTYHFRIVGGNSFGADLGADLTFATAPVPPVVTTLAASGVTATNATLNGTLATGGLNTTAYFRYGLTTNYGSFSATNILAGTNTALSVSTLIGGLSANATYHFRLVATNSAGTARGGDLAFTTPPSVTTLPASSITTTSATLNGTVKPGNGATTTYFRHGSTTNYGSFTATNSVASTNTTLSVSNLISSLVPGTAYHFQLVGINSVGTALGGDLTFTTSAGAPTVTTLAATNVTSTTATLNGRLTTGGLNTTAYFQFGFTTNYGSFTATNSLTATNTTLSVSNLISSLTLVSTYHFRLVVANSAGTASGGDLTFMTLALPPVVTTLPATSITTTTATLNGTVNPKGGATTVYFQYGLTTNYGYLGGFTVLPTATNATLTVPGLVVNSLPGAAGANWTPSSAPGGNWNSIASSADGTRLAAVQHSQPGRIFISTNSGATWTPSSAPGQLWKSIASSADGTRLVAGSNGNGIWTSTNAGLTWAHSFAPPGFAAWYSVTTSADGMRMAGANQSSIYTSVDGGLTWTQSGAPGGNWLCIASSADGTRLTAGIYGGGIWTSADGGLTWTPTSAHGGWQSIASSADGTRLAAGGAGGALWTSADGGVTWIEASLGGSMWCVASSADGMRLAAGWSVGGVSGLGEIFSSTDGGVTWAQSSAPSASWNAIASSADGTKLAATIYGGGIYTSTAEAGGGLTPGTTCHYRLVGVNSAGTTQGSNLTFITNPDAPLVSTLAASGITATTATLNGAVNPYGAATKAYFRYGLTTNYGSFSATNSLPATNATLLVSNLVSSLAKLTTYHYQLVSSNSVGTSLGADRTFTTSAGTPQVTTLPASGFTGATAMLNGTINPNDAATVAYFQYGLTPNYGSFSTTNSLPATNATLLVSNLIGGLSPGMTYHFRLVASNNAGTATGADQIIGNFPHVFTGVEPSQGLDLHGDFFYAVNVGDNGAPGLIGDANFTADDVSGVSITAQGNTLNTIDAWANPNFGDTTDALRLAQAMSSIRWTGAPGILTVNLDGLQVGRSYQLQLLFIESCCDRVFDVTINGTTVVPAFRLWDYGPSGTAIVIPYFFTATGTSALIQLGGGTGENDNNPTLSAFTLEALAPAGTTPVPFSLAGSRGSSGGGFQLSFTNLSGLGFTVLGTTNVGLPLSNWSVLGAPIEAPAGKYQFTDSQTTNNPRRFYRVRSP